jgi:hypothetical protein
MAPAGKRRPNSGQQVCKTPPKGRGRPIPTAGDQFPVAAAVDGGGRFLGREEVAGGGGSDGGGRFLGREEAAIATGAADSRGGRRGRPIPGAVDGGGRAGGRFRGRSRASTGGSSRGGSRRASRGGSTRTSRGDEDGAGIDLQELADGEGEAAAAAGRGGSRLGRAAAAARRGANLSL